MEARAKQQRRPAVDDDCHRSSEEDNDGRRESSISRRYRSYSDSRRCHVGRTRMRSPRSEAQNHYSVDNDHTNDRRRSLSRRRNRSLRRSRSFSACRDYCRFYDDKNDEDKIPARRSRSSRRRRSRSDCSNRSIRRDRRDRHDLRRINDFYRDHNGNRSPTSNTKKADSHLCRGRRQCSNRYIDLYTANDPEKGTASADCCLGSRRRVDSPKDNTDAAEPHSTKRRRK